MKKTFPVIRIGLLAFVVLDFMAPAKIFAQGMVNFANSDRNAGVDAPVFDTDCTTPLGPQFVAQLLAGASTASMSAVGFPVAFRSGAGAGYFTRSTVAINSTAADGTAFVQVRAWEAAAGSTYEAAWAAGAKIGQSTVFSVVPGFPPAVPSALLGLSSFHLTVAGAPTISPITDQQTSEDTPIQAIPFTVADDVTPPSALSLVAQSSDTTLVPNGNMISSGSGASRLLTITPATKRSGMAVITLTVTDTSGLTACEQFNITVTALNPPPTNQPPDISDITNQFMVVGSVLPPIAFIVHDAETMDSNLVVGAFSSNLDLVPDTNIFFRGSGANRLLFIVPMTDQTGSSTITVVVLDSSQASATNIFVLTVDPTNTPLIQRQPISQTARLGQDVELSVGAVAGSSLSYQWRLNGANIPGETNSTLHISNVQVCNGGTYQVVVYNQYGLVKSQKAALTLDIAIDAALRDNFAVSLISSVTSPRGAAKGTNTGATNEVGEPRHAGRPGGKSMWLSWQAPAKGVATFKSCGSGFDTLLAVYTGQAVDKLAPVVSDEDSAGYYTSSVSFNAVAGQAYQIAVDGFYGASGDILLTWEFDETALAVPEILEQPVGQALYLGARTSLMVVAASPSGGQLDFQWFLNGAPFSVGTNYINGTNRNVVTNVLEIRRFSVTNIGTYIVQLKLAPGSGQPVLSQPVVLELGTLGGITTQDKMQNVVDVPVGGSLPAIQRLSAARVAFGSVAAGILGTQIFQNEGSVQADETDPCNVVLDATRWYGFRVETQGTLVVDTIGTQHDTVLTIYRIRPEANLDALDFGDLEQQVCDLTSAPGGRSLIHLEISIDTVAAFPAIYRAQIDSTNQGNVTLNWAFLPKDSPAVWRVLSARRNQNNVDLDLQLVAAPLQWTLEKSSDFKNWVPVASANSWVTPIQLTSFAQFLFFRAKAPLSIGISQPPPLDEQRRDL